MTILREFDVPFEGTRMHCWEGGDGFPLILFHGSGAGCGTFSNFGEVIEPLTNYFHVVATDMIGYGKSGRRQREPYFDMEMWGQQIDALADRFEGRPVGLIGHSLAGAIALKVAARNSKIAGVLATATMGSVMPPQPDGWTWTFPANRDAIRRHIEGTLYDKSLVSEKEIEDRVQVLSAPGYKEYFESMWSKGRQFYFDAAALTSAELASIRCPVVMMHGVQDASFSPEETSLQLAKGIPQADVVVLGRCGHSVALEYPDKVVAVAREMFGTSREHIGRR